MCQADLHDIPVGSYNRGAGLCLSWLESVLMLAATLRANYRVCQCAFRNFVSQTPCDVFIVGAGPTGVCAGVHIQTCLQTSVLHANMVCCLACGHLNHCQPTGLFLAQHGVSSRVFERAPSPSKHPQAHYINNRTMELFRSIPVPSNAIYGDLEGSSGPDTSLAAAVSKLSPPLREWRTFRYVDALVGGELFGEINHFQGTVSASCTVL